MQNIDYQDFFENAPDMLASVDVETKKIITCNQTLHNKLGYSKKEIVGQNVEFIYHPDYLPKARSLFEKFKEKGRIENCEVILKTKEGDALYATLNAVAVRDVNGKPIASHSILRDITELKKHQESFYISSKTLAIMEQTRCYISSGKSIKYTFQILLENILEISASEFGFIGEILLTKKGDPYLKTYAISNIAWNDETRALYEEGTERGMDFHNLNTLFGAAIKTGEAVIANDPPIDPRSGGLPEGHPPLNSFLGLPIKIFDKMIGMVGLANKPGGYDEEFVDILQPFLATCGFLVHSHKNTLRRKKAEEKVKSAALWESELVEFGRFAIKENNVQRIFDKALKVLVNSLDVPFAKILKYNPEKNNFVMQAGLGWKPDVGPGTAVPGGKDSQAGHTFSANEPVIVEDFSREARFSGPDLLTRHDVKSGLSVLIETEDEPYGVLGVHSWEIKKFSAGQVDFVESIAQTVGMAIARDTRERAFQQSESRFRTFLENSADMIMVHDLTGKFFHVNKTAVESHGYSEKEFCDLYIWDIEKNYSKEELFELWNNVIQNREPFRAEGIHQRKDGSRFWVDVNGRMVEIGGEKYIIADCRDLTKRKTLESELKIITQAVEQSPIAILITNFNGVIEYANKKLYEISGYGPGEVIGKTPKLFKGEEIPQEQYESLRKTILFGDEWAGEFHNKKKNGESYRADCYISPVKDEDGKTTHFIGLAQDITEQKKTQAKLETAEREIIASEKLAGIGRLTSGVTHEILNPLNIISLHTQMMLRNTSLDPAVLEKAEKIKNETERIKKICQQLLLFTRQKRVEDDEIFPVQINSELEEIISLLEKDFNLDNIRFVRRLNPGLPESQINRDEMRQVFFNLFNNARYAMQKRGGELTVATEEIKLNAFPYFRIRISDTGSGIKKENMEKLFEPFFTTKPEGEGTGMGLSMVHGIIEKHGGTIDVESEEGKGTAFTIDLPVK